MSDAAPAESALDSRACARYVDAVWEESIVPALLDFIRIPNKSPAFDPRWAEHGFMERAVALIAGWCGSRPIAGLEVEVARLPGRTPLVLVEIPGASADTVLLYGHLDKQPEMSGWRDDLGPWTPVLEGDRLYGRGGADDGYAAFAALAAIEALQRQGVRHARCVVLIEACEESGSFDLPAYVEHLAPRIGSPSLVVCLDSGCGNYQQLWSTTSLRGNVTGELAVQVLREGVHSGDASGVVPSSFRVLRHLLSRIEAPDTGELAADFHVGIPEDRRREAENAAAVLGEEVHSKYPWVPGMGPVSHNPVELVLNRSWRPALSVTGVAGMPALEHAGNVLRPSTSVKLSLRLPPTADATAAAARLGEILERDPPYGAEVRFRSDPPGDGWNAPPTRAWLREAMDRASRAYFGRPAVHMGEGGSIPFMAMLGRAFPQAQFLITGVLGPGSNAHGPNEFLHLPTAKKVTCCVAEVLRAHEARAR